MSQSIHYTSEQEIRDVAQRFESCSYALEEFTHARHITVAVLYLAGHEFETAMAKMRSGLITFSSHHHKMGYNETITRFWLLAVKNFTSPQQQKTLVSRANAAVKHFADKNLIFNHYSRELLFSQQAMEQWTEPDLLPMD